MDQHYQLPICRIVLRRLTNREIDNYQAIRNLRIQVERIPDNDVPIVNVDLPRGPVVNVNEVINPRVIRPQVRRPFRYLPVRVVPNRITHRRALTYREVSVEDVPPYSLGNFTQRCQSCGAKYFDEERPNRQGQFNMCCHLGKIRIEELGECPPELFDYLTSDTPEAVEFQRNIRTVNSNFAMATFKATPPADRNVGQGHWCFTISGQIYHYTEGVPAQRQVEGLKNNQLYFIDAADATNRRHDLIGDRIAIETFRTIEHMLRRTNRLCQAYMFISEVILNYNDDQRLNTVHVLFKENIGRDLGRYNLPATRSEIAAVYTGDTPPRDVDLVVYPHEGNRRNEIKNLNSLADPMVYPILFPNGEYGYRTGIRHTNSDRTVTLRQFYSYRIAVRNGFSILHNGGKLFQQYIVDAWCKVEANDLWFIKQNQKKLRVETRHGLLRHLEVRAQEMGARVGKLVLLPTSRVGSPRYMHSRYREAMAIVARHGKPDLFITFTTNPHWPEIQENLEHRQKFEHRPDLVGRVFRAKFKKFLDDLVHGQWLGKVLNYTYVIEFQKRGLPHAHLLVTFLPEDKIDLESVDSIISAEIPDRLLDPTLYDIVVEHQMHRPCGANKPNASCMQNGKCSKGYPMSYSEESVIDNVRRPLYRRRQNDRFVVIEGTVCDNRRVVPYNRYFAKKFVCHINFEVCASLASMKYLYKYVHKGNDCITVQTVEGNANVVDWDEVQHYLDCRYVSSSEAAFKLMEFPITDRSHSVMTLPVHLEGEEGILFDEEEEDANIQAAANKPSKLTAWFILNQNIPEARIYTYADIPEYFVWEYRTGTWHMRQQTSKMIGQLMEVSPTDVELFHLRIILYNQPGATSFADLRTVNNVEYASFREASLEMGLTRNTDEYARVFEEMAIVNFPHRLRRVFALICCIVTEEQVKEMLTLWERFNVALVDDFIRQGYAPQAAINRCLRSIAKHLARNDKTLQDFNLPQPTDNDDDEMVIDEPINVIDPLTLNRQQLAIFQEIMTTIDAVDNGEVTNNTMFYLDGPGGTGKTYLYNTILTNLVNRGKQTIAVAWTGMASTLLLHGTTVHKAFKLPLSLDERTVAGWPVNHHKSQLIKQASVVIWDEAPMSPKLALNAIDTYLRDLMMTPNKPMGGKVVIMGGDFRQILPVVKRGHRTTVINSTIKHSELWQIVNKRFLTKNMRADRNEIEFANWLIALGDGELPTVQVENKNVPDLIELPRERILNTIDEIIKEVYGENLCHDPSQRAILCPTNKSVDEINEKIKSIIPGDEKIYLSCDEYKVQPDDDFRPDPEFLNSIELPGLPPHRLRPLSGEGVRKRPKWPKCLGFSDRPGAITIIITGAWLNLGRPFGEFDVGTRIRL